MAHPDRPLAILSLIWAGAMFGFFFAWTCSTMWGLDAADPNVAIAAMQAMNESVRNWLFAPAFFGTPVLLAFAAAVAVRGRQRKVAICLALAGLLYVVGAMLPTFMVNVPLNEGLALLEVPLDPATAQNAWQSYSEPWQDWNMVRTVAAGFVLALTGWGLVSFS
ncbi:MAG: DUF1772 domain-containing protein [Boseongicola sp. SB0662_bin_57]|nr:DUF1772 domain-containing protein [Boseongicola sp. SB0662_bin_57]